jgi:ketosteroid isomerase-like protein
MDAIETVKRFNAALNAGDLPAMQALLTSDTVFENTYPPPDGARYAGAAAVGAFWEDFFRSARAPRIEIEELFAAGERCVMRWTYSWRDAAGAPGHIRGVDVYTVRGGLIAEKLSYVKG